MTTFISHSEYCSESTESKQSSNWAAF